MGMPAAQMSNVEPAGHNQQQVQFNQVRDTLVSEGGRGERRDCYLLGIYTRWIHTHTHAHTHIHVLYTPTLTHSH